MTKRDFFPLLEEAFPKAFSPENIEAGWRKCGIIPFDPQQVLVRFETENESDSESDGSGSTLLAREDWKRIYSVIDRRTKCLLDLERSRVDDQLQTVRAENALLKTEIDGLKEAIYDEKRRRKRGKALALLTEEEETGGAIIYSPAKIDRARQLIQDKEDQIQVEQQRKEDQKKQKELEKELKELEKERKAQERLEIRAEARERKAAEQERKRQARIDTQLQRQLAKQAKKDARANKQAAKGKSKAEEAVQEEQVVEVDNTPIPVMSRSGRQLRRPRRLDDNA